MPGDEKDLKTLNWKDLYSKFKNASPILHFYFRNMPVLFSIFSHIELCFRSIKQPHMANHSEEWS